MADDKYRMVGIMASMDINATYYQGDSGFNFGLDANRFSIISYGEERPAAMGSDEAAWSQNRRDEFVITAGQDQINPGQNP